MVVTAALLLVPLPQARGAVAGVLQEPLEVLACMHVTAAWEPLLAAV